MSTLVQRVLTFVVVILTVVALATPVSAAPPIDLPRLDIDYEYKPPLDGHGYWAGDPEGGEWRVVGGGLGRDDRLTLEVEIRPPDISVPLEPGPAVLFGSLGLYGDAGGDVATGASAPRIVTTVLPACPDPTDCVYQGSITLPTDRLPRLAERVRNAEDWISAVVGLTLVRTFAQGTWLQVLPLYDESRHEPDGRLGRPRHISSRMLALGAFPVGPQELWSKRERPALDRIERLRRSVDDPSGLPATQPLLVDIGTAACTPGWTIATATGDVLIDVTRGGPSVPVLVEAPVGAEWTVSVPHFSRGQGTGDPPRTFGPFSGDVPSLVNGWVVGDPYDCEGVESGSVDWKPASPDEVASFVTSEPADVLATYATLPDGDDVTAADLPFERLWRPLDPAEIPFEYVCEPGLPFTTSDLATAQGLDDVEEPVAAAVRHWAERISSASAGWEVVRQDDRELLALAPGRRGWMESMKLDSREGETFAGLDPESAWDFVTGGDCRARTMFLAGRWRLDPRFPRPGPKTRTLHVLGYLGCNGTEKAGPARIHTTDDAVLIAIPMRSTTHSDACAGVGPTRMTIRLPEPLGRRTLYDAGTLPLRGADERLDIDHIKTSGSGG